VTCSQSRLFRPGRSYGEPHPGNSTDPMKGFYFIVDTGPVSLGHVAGYVSPEEFDWLAERIGTPKLAEVRRG
jgi:hypothetical protein